MPGQDSCAATNPEFELDDREPVVLKAGDLAHLFDLLRGDGGTAAAA
jgi:hypothetical protein